MMQHITDDHDALLDYLYEEGDAAERLKIARHLQECAPCSVAVLEFQNVRGMLRDWTPPASELGFRIVQETQVPACRPRALDVAIRHTGRRPPRLRSCLQPGWPYRSSA